ncbi:hypothetical protein BH24ACT11_BH24ACT11_01310 [soil metagenome]
MRTVRNWRSADAVAPIARPEGAKALTVNCRRTGTASTIFGPSIALVVSPRWSRAALRAPGVKVSNDPAKRLVGYCCKTKARLSQPCTARPTPRSNLLVRGPARLAGQRPATRVTLVRAGAAGPPRLGASGLSAVGLVDRLVSEGARLLSDPEGVSVVVLGEIDRLADGLVVDSALRDDSAGSVHEVAAPTSSRHITVLAAVVRGTDIIASNYHTLRGHVGVTLTCPTV